MTNSQSIARDSRLKVLDLIYKAQTSHVGSNFSCADIMAVLFEKINLDKDQLVLSAGWKAAMLYYHLWRKGRITLEQLDSYCQEGSEFIGLAEPIVPEIIIAGGSMGMGLPGAVGLALAKKLKGEEGKVYCLMSDGEIPIGTTLESALIAVHHKLNNLIVIVDQNSWQAMGKTEDVLKQDPKKLFDACGWVSHETDGNDCAGFEQSLHPGNLINLAASHGERPRCFIARTTKGKGVSFMENNNLFHYKAPTEEEYLKAKEELNGLQI